MRFVLRVCKLKYSWVRRVLILIVQNSKYSEYDEYVEYRARNTQSMMGT